MVSIERGPYGGPEEFRIQALAILDGALRPVDRNALIIMLAKLHRATKGRNESEQDRDFWMAVFGDELSDYPNDILDEAVRKWIRRETWLPSVAEMRAECDQLVRWRRETRAALAA